MSRYTGVWGPAGWFPARLLNFSREDGHHGIVEAVIQNCARLRSSFAPSAIIDGCAPTGPLWSRVERIFATHTTQYV